MVKIEVENERDGQQLAQSGFTTRAGSDLPSARANPSTPSPPNVKAEQLVHRYDGPSPKTSRGKARPKAEPGSDSTPSKKRKANDTGGGGDGGWDAQKRLKLFELYQAHSAVRWDDLARDMGPGYTGKQCREQWQRATGKKIRAALDQA